ncbi:MAG: beta-ketoacyl-ACP synthase I [Candidatus Dasytiphilus stammeri]
MKRAVITGLGIVSSIGNNKKEVLSSLQKGQSGICFSQELKNCGMRSHVWGNIKKDSRESYDFIPPKIIRFMNDASIYAYISMQEAIIDSGLTSKMISDERTGLIVGGGYGSSRFEILGVDAMRSFRGIKAVSPYIVTKTMSSAISACLATAFKIHGINYSISSACATSAHCVGNAVEQIQINKQTIVFAGGSEELNWELAYKFDAMGVLSTRYNKSPEKASRVYDINRDGFVIAGGAGIVVIEELEHALSRGAHIYAEVIGYGANSDGENMVIPSGGGAVRCMRMALKNVDSTIDYLNVHGTSTLIGDIKELNAICEVFRAIKTEPLPISATKSMTGHSLGAAGVQEIIYTLIMLEYGFIAPSINIYSLDPAARVDGVNIITKMTKYSLRTVMSNSFGFGGTNATLVMRNYSF